MQKHIFVEKKNLEIAALTAACIFIKEYMPISKIMEVMGVQVGPKSMAYAQTYNDHRIMRAEKETSDASSRRPGHLAEQKN